jgi:hypothetical protein
MNLTQHFTDEELGLAGCDVRIVSNATYLCERILEPIRAHYDKPIRIHSGYRDPVHNARVGGKPDSWHLYEGNHAAADFDVVGVLLKDCFDWIRLQSKLNFDKVIIEYAGDQPATIHIQVDAIEEPRRLAYVGGTGDSHSYTPVMVA